MTAMRQRTSTGVMVGRPSGRPRHERLLESITRLEEGEGRCLLLFFAYAFLLLVAYYIVRTLREPLLLVNASAEIKTYASATAALALLCLVPLYGVAFRRAERNQLVRWVTTFFIGSLGALYLAAGSGADIGFVYYVWAAIFGVTIVAQFWAHAADCFDVAAGRRLFPVIMTGATLGGIAGPSIFRALHGMLDHGQLMLVAMALLIATLPLVKWTRSSVPRRSRVEPAAEQSAVNVLGGFSLVLRDRYLLLIALLIVLLNCVNTMGEYLLTDFVVRDAAEQVAREPWLDKGQLIGEFYARFFLATNALTVLMQVFLVGRLFRWIGVSGALLVLPAVALLGYGLVALLPIFNLLRVVRVCENAGNYSVLNTARQALFLPLSSGGKYEGKIATDTFFWRFGDLLPAAIVYVGLNWFALSAQQFALVNVGLSLVWLGVAVQLAKRAPGRAADGDVVGVRLAAGIRALVRAVPTLAVATRASSWLAVAVGLAALGSSAPAKTAPALDAGGTSAARLFDSSEPLAMELLFDSKALCRDPRRQSCNDLPATLSYRDALGETQSVDVALRTRGRYRADTVQCGLPALFVFFKGDTLGTLFAGESMLPLTTHCARTAGYEQYLLKEYLAYRIYNALTSKSLRVRLVRMTYRDAAGLSKPLERYAFFTEHFDSFARRQGAVVHEKQPFDPRSGDPLEVATLDLFEYAIGNTDWSAVHGHNVLLVESPNGLVTPVPYDFDFSGLVDAEYATVAPQLAIRSVRQRVFRGLCDVETDWDAAFAHFTARHEVVQRLAHEIPDLEPDERAGVLAYLDEAFAVIGSPERRTQRIVEACRSIDRGL